MKRFCEKIQSAYRAERERQTQKLRHEIEITEAIVGPHNTVVMAAKTLVREIEKKMIKPTENK